MSADTLLVTVKLPSRRHCEFCGTAVPDDHTGPTSCCDGSACYGGHPHYGGTTHEFEYGDDVTVVACCVFVADAAHDKAVGS